MAATKNKIFIIDELDFLEEQALELKAYVQANPISKLEDRIHWKELKNGGVLPVVTASKEAQRKDIAQALKDYAAILEVINKLRDMEEKKIETRGSVPISSIAEDFLKKNA